MNAERIAELRGIMSRSPSSSSVDAQLMRYGLAEALDEIARLQSIFCRIEDLAHPADWFDFPKKALLDLVGESGPWDAAAMEGKTE